MSFPKQQEPESRYESARRKAVRRVRSQILCGAHLMIWLFLILLPSWNRPGPSPAWLWTPVILIHYLVAFGHWERFVERATRREMERLERAGYVVSERMVEHEKPKAKRNESSAGQTLRLSDDGELEAYDPDEEIEASRPRRREVNR